MDVISPNCYFLILLLLTEPYLKLKWRCNRELFYLLYRMSILKLFILSIFPPVHTIKIWKINQLYAPFFLTVSCGGIQYFRDVSALLVCGLNLFSMILLIAGQSQNGNKYMFANLRFVTIFFMYNAQNNLICGWVTWKYCSWTGDLYFTMFDETMDHLMLIS